MNSPKQIIVVRKDLNMRRGKQISQGCHASLGAILGEMSKDDTTYTLSMVKDTPIHDWIVGNFKKICVSVNSEEELRAIHQQAKDAGLIACLITDSGLTEFGGVPTLTTCAIGPAYPAQVDPITSHLPLL